MRSARLRRGEATIDDLKAALDRLEVGAGDDFWLVRENPQVSGGELYELDEHDQLKIGPFHRNGASTSDREAAKDMYPRSGSLRHICLVEIAAAGQRGITSDEVAAKHGKHLPSVKPRFVELRENGWIEMNGAVRISAMGSGVDVHVITDEGLHELQVHDESS